MPDLMSDQEAARIINSPPVVAAIRPANLPALSAPAASVASENNEQGHYKKNHQRLTRAKDVRSIAAFRTSIDHDFELAEEERQALVRRATAKKAILENGAIRPLLDKIHRASTGDRLLELKGQAMDLLAEQAPDYGAEINRAITDRAGKISEFQYVGIIGSVALVIIALTGFILFHHWPDQDGLFSASFFLVGFTGYCIISQFYRTDQAKLGFKVNWVKVIQNGKMGKGFILLCLLSWWFGALTLTFTLKGW